MNDEIKRETEARKPAFEGDKRRKEPHPVSRKAAPRSREATEGSAPVRRDLAAQFVGTQHGGHNDGTSSAEPRIFSQDEEGDATFPLNQSKK